MIVSVNSVPWMTLAKHALLLVCLACPTRVSAQVHTPRELWTLQRMTVAEDNVYGFARSEEDTRAGPRFVKMSVSLRGEGAEEGQRDLWGGWGSDRQRISMRWRVVGNTLYMASYSDYGTGGYWAGLARFPLRFLIPYPKPTEAFVHSTPGYPELRGQTTQIRVSPVSWAAGKALTLTESGYRTKAPDWFETKEVYFDFRVLDEKRVELLMTMDGKPSLWEYDGTQDREEWKNRPSRAGETIIRDADEPVLLESGWHHKRNLSVTIDGPFLWMQDPKYAVAEREGNWCVIGPLNAAEAEVRPIIAKDAEHPLVLVEDVAAKANYFRLGDKLMDDSGAVIERVDASKPLEDQMREVVSNVVLLRRDR